MTIEELIQEGDAIRASIGQTHKMGKEPEYHVWKQKVLRYLNQTVPGDMVINRFEKAIDSVNVNYCSQNSFDKVLSVLKAFQELPQHTKDTMVARGAEVDKSVKIVNNVNQSQTQNQTQTTIIFAEVIKDELKGKQVKELKAIVAENINDPQKCEEKLAEKFKEYGEETMSRVLANIVKHPEVLPNL